MYCMKNKAWRTIEQRAEIYTQRIRHGESTGADSSPEAAPSLCVCFIGFVFYRAEDAYLPRHIAQQVLPFFS